VLVSSANYIDGALVVEKKWPPEKYAGDLADCGFVMKSGTDR